MHYAHSNNDDCVQDLLSLDSSGRLLHVLAQTLCIVPSVALRCPRVSLLCRVNVAPLPIGRYVSIGRARRSLLKLLQEYDHLAEGMITSTSLHVRVMTASPLQALRIPTGVATTSASRLRLRLPSHSAATLVSKDR